MKRAIYTLMMRIIGWGIINHNEVMPDKYVVAVIPHTSNWDFPKGIFVRSIMGEDIRFVGKRSLFWWPLGPILKAMGGYPVDRSKNTNFVDAVAALFKEKKSFKICITPEGTRKRVEKLKTGFYYIAKKAEVPILLCRFDYDRRVVEFSEPFWPTDDKEADFEFIHDYFRGIRGKYPEYSFLYETPSSSTTT